MKPSHLSLCYCPDCRAAEQSRQKKLTILLSTVLGLALWLLFKEASK